MGVHKFLVTNRNPWVLPVDYLTLLEVAKSSPDYTESQGQFNLSFLFSSFEKMLATEIKEQILKVDYCVFEIKEKLTEDVRVFCKTKIHEGMDLSGTLQELFMLLNFCNSQRTQLELLTAQALNGQVYTKTIEKAFKTFFEKHKNDFLPEDIKKISETEKIINNVCESTTAGAELKSKVIKQELESLKSLSNVLLRFESSIRMFFKERDLEKVYDKSSKNNAASSHFSVDVI